MKKVRLIAIILCFVLISNFTVGIIDKIVALASIVDLDEDYWALDASYNFAKS